MIYQWEFRQLWQYFDAGNRAIERNAGEMAKLQPETRQELFGRMTLAIRRYILDFSGTPEEFCRLMGTAVNDLYRTICRIPRYTEPQRNYLAATARPMMDALKERGISVHFATVNGMDPDRPKSDVLVARKFWNDCGFFFFETFSYPDRKIALRHMAEKIREIGKASYVMMIPDGNKTELKPFYEAVGSQGIMSFFKSQPSADPSFKTYPLRLATGTGSTETPPPPPARK